MKEKIIQLKSKSCTILNEAELSNCERQVIGRLVNLLDAILLDKLDKQVRRSEVTYDAYVSMKFLEIITTLEGYKNIDTSEIVILLKEF